MKAEGITSHRLHKLFIDVGMEVMERQKRNSYVVRKLEASDVSTHCSDPQSQLCVLISTDGVALPSGGAITVPIGPLTKLHHLPVAQTIYIFLCSHCCIEGMVNHSQS